MMPKGQTAGKIEVADAGEPALEDRVLVAEVRVLRQVLPHPDHEVLDVVERLVGQVLCDPAGSDVGVVHPQAGDQLEGVQHLLPLPESNRHHRQRADLHAAGGDADQVRGDPVELQHHHPDDVGLLRDLGFDVEQPLDAEAVGRLVVQWREVIHPGAERNALGPVAELHVLLDAGVQVTDAAPGLGNALTLQLQDQPEYAVGRRVLRTHVHHDPLVAALGLLGHQGVPVLSGDGIDVALRRVGRRQRRDLAVLLRRSCRWCS